MPIHDSARRRRARGGGRVSVVAKIIISGSRIKWGHGGFCSTILLLRAGKWVPKWLETGRTDMLLTTILGPLRESPRHWRDHRSRGGVVCGLP